jgi:hypothetical protein
MQVYVYEYIPDDLRFISARIRFFYPSTMTIYMMLVFFKSLQLKVRWRAYSRQLKGALEVS